MWLNIRCNFVHSRTFFTPKIHPPLTTWPAPRLAHDQNRPATRPGPSPDPAPHPTQAPPPPPCLPPRLAGLPSQTALPASSATTASRALRCTSAVLVLLQRLCVWGASQHATPSNILHSGTHHLIFYIPHLIFYIPPPKFYIPHLIFYITPPKLYINLTCGALDT